MDMNEMEAIDEFLIGNTVKDISKQQLKMENSTAIDSKVQIKKSQAQKQILGRNGGQKTQSTGSFAKVLPEPLGNKGNARGRQTEIQSRMIGKPTPNSPILIVDCAQQASQPAKKY